MITASLSNFAQNFLLNFLNLLLIAQNLPLIGLNKLLIALDLLLNILNFLLNVGLLNLLLIALNDDCNQ